jgi:hypothetical protein
MRMSKRESENGNVPLYTPRSFLYERSYTNFSLTCIGSTFCGLHNRGLCGWVDLLQRQIFYCKMCGAFGSWSLLLAVCTVQYTILYIYIFFCGSATQSGSWSHFWGFLITHDAPQLVGLLWTNNQLVAETSTWQHTTLATDKHPCTRWVSNPRSQQASGCRPRP